MSSSSSALQFFMGQTPQGELTHFPMIGLLSVFCTCAGISLSRYLRPAVEDRSVSATAVWVE